MGDDTIRSMEFLQEVFDALTSHICVVDQTGLIVLTNAAWKRFSEQNSGNAGSEGNYLEICKAASQDGCGIAGQFRDGLLAVLENRVPCFMLEYDCHSPNEERWFVCRITRLEHAGQPLAVISHQNITPKILAELSLEQSEALFRATFNQAVAGIVQCNLEGHFIRVNQAFCRIIGYREDELLQMTFMDITQPEDLAEDLALAGQLLDGSLEHGYSLEKRYICKNRDVIWVNLHASLVHNRDGSPRYFVGVVDDISDRKKAEARAQELNLKLEQRLELLTSPESEGGSLQFSDLFDCSEIQKLQDLMTASLGVSSIITTPDGTPITSPSNFCRLCSELIRTSTVGHARCKASNIKMGAVKPGERFVSQCHSAGLLDGGTSILVGDRRIANWVVGQVLDEASDMEAMLDYADEIGVDREQYRMALAQVPKMSRQRFEAICSFVAQIAHQLSTQALRNFQQARAIEQRIRAEEALEEQKLELSQISRKLQLVIETIGDGITLSDRYGRFSIYNQQMVQITGYSMEEANSTGAFLRRLYPDQAAQREVLEELALLEKFGENRNVETSIVSKSGAVRTLSVSSVIISLDGEKQYLTAWHDFTNRKLLTDALQESEQRFSTISRVAGDAIIMMNHRGSISYWNPAAEAIFGYTQQEVIGEDLHRLLAPQRYRQMAYDGMHEWQMSQLGPAIGRRVELFGQRKDGSEFPFELTLSSVELNGRLTAIGILREITERHRAAEELRRSEQQFRSLIETTSEGFSAINPQTRRTVLVNQAFCTMLGYSREELLDRQTIEFVVPEDREVIQQQYSLIQETDHRSYDVSLLTRDGRRLQTHFSASTLRDEEGTPVLAYAFITDISERKRYEADIQQAREAAESASKAKSNFLANMSHELRTPLNSVIGFTELIHDGIPGPVNQLQQEYLGNVLTSSRHLLQIISEILDLSRIEAGKLKLERSSTSLDSLLLQVQSMFSDQARSGNIAFSVAAGHPSGMLITADEVKLRQVLINLVSNALKFTRSGDRVEICTAVHEQLADGPWLELTVRDTGIGIRQEDFSKLFQEFSQIEPAMTRNKDGTGLGLALSKRLVELHRGTIRVESSFGVGSSFIVTLPLGEPAPYE